MRTGATENAGVAKMQGVEIVGVENAAPDCRGAKRGSNEYGKPKFPQMFRGRRHQKSGAVVSLRRQRAFGISKYFSPIVNFAIVADASSCAKCGA